ncbi:MAG: hypothetical protein ACRERD_08470 [Candidatus Binatia bacterium]
MKGCTGAAAADALAFGPAFQVRRGKAQLEGVPSYKFTDYFANEVLRNRSYLQKE